MAASNGRAPLLVPKDEDPFEHKRRNRRKQAPQQAHQEHVQTQTATDQPAPAHQGPVLQMQQHQSFRPIVGHSQPTGWCWRKEGRTRVFVHQAPPKEQSQQTTAAPHTQPTSDGTPVSSRPTQAKASPDATTGPSKLRADAPAFVPGAQMLVAVVRTEGEGTADTAAGDRAADKQTEQAAADTACAETATAQQATAEQPEQAAADTSTVDAAAAETAGANTAAAEQPEQAATGLAAVEQASVEMASSEQAADELVAAEHASAEMAPAETAAAETPEGQLVSVNIFVGESGSLTVTLSVADVLGAPKDDCSEAQASDEQQGVNSEAQASDEQQGDSEAQASGEQQGECTAKAGAVSSDKSAYSGEWAAFATPQASPRISAVMSGSVAPHDSVDGGSLVVVVSRRGTREDAPVASKPAVTEVDAFDDVPCFQTRGVLVRVFATRADALFADGVRLSFKRYTDPLSSQGHVYSCSSPGGMAQSETDKETAQKQRLLQDLAGSYSCGEFPVLHVKVATKAGFLPDCVTEAASCWKRGMGRFVRKGVSLFTRKQHSTHGKADT